MRLTSLVFGTSFAAIIRQGSAFSSTLSRCPLPCSVSGPEPSNWTYYHDINALQDCNEPTLFDLNIYNPVQNQNAHVALRACVAAPSSDTTVRRATSTCGHKTSQTQADIQLIWWGKTDAGVSTQVASAAEQLRSALQQDEANCEESSSILFAQSGNAVVGMYVGSEIEKLSAADIIQKFIDYGNARSGLPDRLAAQLCGNIGSQIFGVFADTTGNVSAVQEALRSWNEAKCLAGFDGEQVWPNTAVAMILPSPMSSATKRSLDPRGNTCSYIQVNAGDGCSSLAQRCRISQADLQKYNPGLNFCNTLKPGQYVCCSSGSLPDFSPKKNADGSCFSYTVKTGDVCANIATAHNMTPNQIEAYNNHTWGWQGCDHLMVGQVICLSEGDPPMPAPIQNAVCGPQVPGTKKPTNGTVLADLNPCPLNACCDIWGQCGITPDFCTPDPASTGAPGTAKPGSNGCISNCGTNITNNNAQPKNFFRVGYFEAFNGDRPCLHMAPSDVDTSTYTHVHYAFANITSDYQVDVSKYQNVFKEFVNLKGIKRILSFGGWSFSTSADSYPIFRNGVTEAQRSQFAKNVAKFIVDNNLDGVDFDWEYPGATDIPGIPPGSPSDGPNYLAFLKEVRAALPSGKSVSIAAPASYWYLKGFPIKEISDVVDYIIYMTYDLHGQWDYGNKNVDPGCPKGNCLRSHVNMTETQYALAMITKAGVPASKVIVGQAWYGRSFQMSQAGCWGPNCTFTGPDSGAWPGPCTQTPGYLSFYEIQEIISQANEPDLYNTTVQQEQLSDMSDILIYDSTQWVSYLSLNSYGQRLGWYASHNFGGTVDWALDLLADYSGGKAFDGDESQGEDAPCDFSVTFNTLADLAKASSKYSPYCSQIYAVQTLSNELSTAMANYSAVNNGYDDLFGYYVDYVKSMIPGALDSFMDYKNGKGNQYFNCTLNVDGRNTTTQKCPLPEKTLASGSYELYFDLVDPNGFYNALEQDYGIDKSWVKFGTKDFENSCVGQQHGCIIIRRIWNGYPQEADNINVPNPKDLLTKAVPSMQSLQDKIDATWMDLMLAEWNGTALDAAQVLALPVAMVQQAVDSMAQVKQIGKTEEEQKKKELILDIVTAVVAVVP
ncbi:hypothetical protein T310_8420, partial [Rasamsonia emersonii CBS 393.64]